MKILQRKTDVASKKAEERQKEIAEGAKLAKSVDALRQARSLEESNLAKFREASLKQVKGQIDEKIQEVKKLEEDIVNRREERMRLESPIDLTNKWREVNSLKKELELREVDIINKEIMLHDVEKISKEVKEKEYKTSLLFEEARKTFTKTDDIRNEMEARKKEWETIHKTRLSELEAKEKNVVEREYVAKQQLEQVEKDKKDILNSNISIIERESYVETKEKELKEKEFEIKEQEKLTKRMNDEASQNYDKADSIKKEIESWKAKIEADINSKLEDLSVRQQELGYKERDFMLEKQSLENEKIEMEKEKAHIISQQQTLRTAWTNIKNLQK